LGRPASIALRVGFVKKTDSVWCGMKLEVEGLDKVSKEYEMGREKEYEINEKLKKTKKEDLDWSTGQ